MRKTGILAAYVVATCALGALVSAAQPARAGPESPADGALRQTAPASARASRPLPTFEAAKLEARIAEASANATHDNRRVLVMWGSNADKPSQALIELTVRDSDVAQKLLYEYDIVRADPAGNEALAAKLGAETRGTSLPRLTVLDAGGRVIASEAAASFTSGGAASSVLDPQRVVDFLTKHQASPLNAATLLSAALGQAKKDQKALFLWFSAPW